MQGGAFGFHVHLNHLLAVVPRTACVGQIHGLEQTEHGDTDQIADKQAHGVLSSDTLGRREAGESQCKAEDGDKDVDHAALCVVGANLHHLLALLGVGLLGGVGVKLDVALDIFHGAVGTGGDSLHRGASEPVDDAAAKDEPDDGIGVEEVKDGGGLNAECLLDKQDKGENHGGGAHYSGADKHGLGGSFEGVASPVVSFEVVFGLLEIGGEAELLLYLAGGLLLVVLDKGQLVHALCIVGDGPIAVHGNGHRTHAQHAEGYQAEGEDGIVVAENEGEVKSRGGQVGDNHQHHKHQSGPESAHVAGHNARKDVQRGTALFRSLDHFLHMLGGGGGERLPGCRS